MTEDRAWQSEREQAIAWHASSLERLQRFWDHEAGIPLRLRRRVVGYVAQGGLVLAPDPVQYIAHLEARRRWLASHGLPGGSEPLFAAEPAP
jgi:hypothetical protein